MKRLFKIMIVVAVVVLSSSISYAQIPDLTSFATGCLANVFEFYPPEILEVKTEPATPVPDQSTTVVAKIANNAEKTDQETIAAYLHYSVDGGKKWEDVEMEQDENDTKIWRAKIPGQPSGSEVVYYISAVDTVNNVTSEMPGMSKVEKWPPKEGEILFSAPSINDCPVEDVPDLDIKEMALGYDEEYFYGKVTVEGKFSGGTVSPPDARIYAFAGMNLDSGEDLDINAITSGAQKGYALVYGELIPDLGGSALGWGELNAVDARVATTQQPVPKAESGDALYKPNENTVYYRIKRSMIGSNPSGRIQVLALSVHITTADLVSALTGGSLSGITPKDVSPFLRIYLRNHKYKVP